MLILFTLLVPGPLLSIGMLLILPWKCPEYPNIWTDGSREDFSSIGGFEVAGAGVYSLAFRACF